MGNTETDKAIGVFTVPIGGVGFVVDGIYGDLRERVNTDGEVVNLRVELIGCKLELLHGGYSFHVWDRRMMDLRSIR
jgi:hypothetical protein